MFPLLSSTCTVVFIVNVAQVEFPARSLTRNVCAPVVVMSVPLVYAPLSSMALDKLLSENVIVAFHV